MFSAGTVNVLNKRRPDQLGDADEVSAETSSSSYDANGSDADDDDDGVASVDELTHDRQTGGAQSPPPRPPGGGKPDQTGQPNKGFEPAAEGTANDMGKRFIEELLAEFDKPASIHEDDAADNNQGRHGGLMFEIVADLALSNKE